MLILLDKRATSDNETKLSKLTADANYMRYLNKISLQNKFFNTTLTEVKI